MPAKKTPAPRREQADGETIARLREIAADSANHAILADGPVSPDAELLDDCAEALHLLSHAERMMEMALIFAGRYRGGLGDL